MSSAPLRLILMHHPYRFIITECIWSDDAFSSFCQRIWDAIHIHNARGKFLCGEMHTRFYSMLEWSHSDANSGMWWSTFLHMCIYLWIHIHTDDGFTNTTLLMILGVPICPPSIYHTDKAHHTLHLIYLPMTQKTVFEKKLLKFCCWHVACNVYHRLLYVIMHNVVYISIYQPMRITTHNSVIQWSVLALLDIGAHTVIYCDYNAELPFDDDNKHKQKWAITRANTRVSLYSLSVPNKRLKAHLKNGLCHQQWYTCRCHHRQTALVPCARGLIIIQREPPLSSPSPSSSSTSFPYRW